MSDDEAGTVGILRRQAAPKPMSVWLQAPMLLIVSMINVLVMAFLALAIAIAAHTKRTQGWGAVAGPLAGGAAIMAGGAAISLALAWGPATWPRRKGAELARCPDSERATIARRAMRTAAFALLLFGSLLQIAPTLMP